jgi:WD40 repeat protein
MDRVRLWDLARQHQLETPEHGYMLRGPPTCMIWANRHAGPGDILAFGTGSGYLVFWRESQKEVRWVYNATGCPSLTSLQRKFVELCSQRLATGTEVTCIAWDRANEATFRLATATRDRIVQLWSFNGKDVHEIFSRQLTTTIPKNIEFMENQAADIYVFGIYGGRWCARRTLSTILK